MRRVIHTILVICASLKGFDWFFPFKEAHLSAYLLQGAISLRMSWVCRTWDYLNDDDGFAYPDVAPHIATTLEAMKIGGMYPSPWVPQDHLGTYLCTLNSVFLEHGPYPFLNVPEPISAEEWRNSSSHLLTIGDMGLMNIFLAADGSDRWAADG